MTKIAPIDEAITYKAVNGIETQGFTTSQLNSLAKLKPFIPELYEIKEIEQMCVFQSHKAAAYNTIREEKMAEIVMENLLFEHENTASFIDLKIGQSTLTKRAKSMNQQKIEHRNAKDAKRTSGACGFSITGYCT